MAYHLVSHISPELSLFQPENPPLYKKRDVWPLYNHSFEEINGRNSNQFYPVLITNKMELKVFNILLCRTPVFSVEDNLEEKWGELQMLIHDSSPALFEIIKDLNYTQLKLDDKKVNYSVWKYFNRARFRATPFGRFAAFSVVNLTNTSCSNLVLQHELNTTDLIDWIAKDELIGDLGTVLKHANRFQKNTSIYRVGNEIRFIRFKNDCFEIASVIAFQELDTLLKLCDGKVIKQDVYNTMHSLHDLYTKDVKILLEQMLTLQLISCDRLPNVTGEDYFQRLNFKDVKAHAKYTIAEREIISGGFNCRKVEIIPNLIRFLQINVPHHENGSLKDFKIAFSKKFDQATIPLLIAIDPELGVGYSNLADAKEEMDLIDVINKSKRKSDFDTQLSYSKFHQYLLNSMLSGNEIKLEAFENLEDNEPLPLPNSLSVMLHLFEGTPVIESIGGCTANALTGRFTVASQELTKSGKQIAALEQMANPGIIFFDIAYQAEKKVDNVNRREQLYSHELPILTWSDHPSTLSLDDIFVTIRNSEIVLWSKKFNKRLIPRIPSAYNYSRSDLAIYRFLCDLQHQGVLSGLSFNLQEFFPKLARYPRVSYKDIIVSPAMWLLPNKIKDNLNGKKRDDEAISILKTWLKESGIDFYIRAGNSDQKLCFNPNSESDLDALLSYCRQNRLNEIYFSEALLSNKPEVSDENGKFYISEYILNYGHSDQVYKANFKVDTEMNTSLPTNILPGDEWLYFEIYCHPSRINEVLLIHIDRFLKASKKDVSQWFFIRYDDPAPHLRLRLKLSDIRAGYQIINRLNSNLQQAFTNGLISDVQIKTYFREMERYGPDRIELVEEFFFIDSKNVKSLLTNQYSIDELYTLTLTFIQNLLNLTFNNIVEQIDFATTMANSFKEEFRLDMHSFKKINQSFQVQKQAIKVSGDQLPDLSSSYTNPLFKILNKCDSWKIRAKIISDLVHMHINRLFNSHQRSHEAIIYQYLVKLLKAKQAAVINLQVSQAEL